MSLLKGVIAQISVTLSRATATPTQPAGPVPPERTTPLGSKPIALDTHLHHQSAPTQPSLSSGLARSIILERKRGSAKTTALVTKPPTVDGLK